MEPIRRKLLELDAGERQSIIQALELFASKVDGFGALPQSVIHGEFFGRNVVIRERSPDQMIAAVDWECAAIGPSYLDLASVSAGNWSREQKQAMWRTYFDRYQEATDIWLDWESFRQDVAGLALYQALAMLGWRLERNLLKHFDRWMRELEWAMHESQASYPAMLGQE